MNKDNILYGIIGLLAGVILGYLLTNSLNRSAPAPSPVAASGGTAAPGNTALPADHPPLESASGGSGSGPQGDVTAEIEKARNEPQNFEAQMRAASLYYQIQRYDQALEFLQRAHQLKPNDFVVLAGLGNATFDLQRYPEAERWYQMALKLKPDDVNVRIDLGLTYALREPPELDKAIMAYRAALTYDPRHEKALQNLTTALTEKGDKAAAREALKRLEEVNPNNQALAELRARVAAP
jgi:tetratricopeptide (TPR) repeat protein